MQVINRSRSEKERLAKSCRAAIAEAIIAATLEDVAAAHARRTAAWAERMAWETGCEMDCEIVWRAALLAHVPAAVLRNYPLVADCADLVEAYQRRVAPPSDELRLAARILRLADGLAAAKIAA